MRTGFRTVRRWRHRLSREQCCQAGTLLTHSPRRWTLGSILFLSSFAAIMGPWAYVQHLASTPRLPFTAAYFGSLGLTLYFSVGVSPRSFFRQNKPASMLRLRLAPKHAPHAVCGAHATGLSDLVSGELLPDGQQRTAPRQHLWRSQGSCLDDQLKGPIGHSVGDTCSYCPCTVHHRVKGVFFKRTGFGASWRPGRSLVDTARGRS